MRECVTFYGNSVIHDYAESAVPTPVEAAPNAAGESPQMIRIEGLGEPVDDVDEVSDIEPRDAYTCLVRAMAPGLTMLEALMLAGTVTEAAKLSGVSQPTLTRAMVRWEAAASTTLFDRSGRRIEFSGPGRELAAAAISALDNLRAALTRGSATEPERRLFLGSLHSLGQSVVIELTAEYLNRQPSESIRLSESNSMDICAKVRNGILDLGVVDRPPDLTGFGWCTMGRQSLSLVLSATDPRSTAPCADMRDFKDESFVSLDRRFHSRLAADALCAEAGFTPNIVLESDEPARLRHYVGDGRGVAILPFDYSINPRVRNVRINSELAVREFGVLSDLQRPLIPAARKFINNIMEIEQRYPRWADLLDH